MINKHIILNILTILSILAALIGGYYMGIKDSFAIGCLNQGKIAIIIDNKQVCISQNFTYDLCHPKFSDYFLDMELKYGGQIKESE